MFAFLRRMPDNNVTWLGFAVEARSARQVAVVTSKQIHGVVECVYNAPNGETQVCCAFEDGELKSEREYKGQRCTELT